MSDDDPQSRSLFARFRGALGGRNGSGETPLPADPVPVTESALLANAQAFDRLRVSDVMVPRADITAVDVETPLHELAVIFSNAAHSRLPIYRDTLDDPIGVAHIKDVITHLTGDEHGNRSTNWAELQILPQIRRPLLYAPPSMRATDLLLRMQSRRMHMALVVDEFGGTDGLVTLEDLLEPIVGDIEDEHDETLTPAIKAKGPDVWEADARAAIEDFEEVVGRDVASEEEEQDVDTLGGLVFMLAGRIPERGEVIRHPSGFEFEILDSDPRRIKRLRVRPYQVETEADLVGK